MTLRGRRVLITAGPTREHLDPIRFMSNASSGAMGFALARAARAKGARVTVVSGPAAGGASAGTPRGVEVVPVVSALQMYRAVMARCRAADVVIGAAAVGDWRFKRASGGKIKRTREPLTVTLVPNPDIIAAAARRARRGRGPRVVIGFALETSRWLARAREKLERKGLDLVVANRPDSLGARRSSAALVTRGSTTVLPRMDKDRLAGRILAAVEELS